ncbi:MAG TPA: CocE/NonD family hydrolase [Anaerolineae bacterium]|nr:CocE/NonD family hydrolase [Anaerolineae bacterium]
MEARPAPTVVMPEARPSATAGPQAGASLQGALRVQPPSREPAQSAYLRLRRSHVTTLTACNPTPARWWAAAPPPGARETCYPSGDLQLLAWLALPEDAPTPIPAIVYLHGDWGLDGDDFAACRPFLDAGYAVMLPSPRGENGNPGCFELWYGEMDDAVAAVRWLAGQPEIDAGRIYAFGHSVGGGVAALLSLYDDVPLRLSGSCGGLYPPDILAVWSALLPFDLNDEQEVQLRLLRGNMASMQRRHIAYLGEEEWLAQFASAAAAEAAACVAPLSIHMLPGDHESALAPAMAAFIEAIADGMPATDHQDTNQVMRRQSCQRISGTD